MDERLLWACGAVAVLTAIVLMEVDPPAKRPPARRAFIYLGLVVAWPMFTGILIGTGMLWCLHKVTERVPERWAFWR